MGDAVLSLRGFGVAFGEKVILADLNLEILEREVTVLMGPCGTGKSTLLRTLAGFNDANTQLRLWGEAAYLGLPLEQGERPSMVAQSARLMMASILENIVHELPERRSLSPLQQRDLALRLLQDAGLDELCERLDEPVINLNLAQQRHLSILRLAATGTRLICMDEPTASLSDEDAAPILQYVVRESTRRAMLVVSHNQMHARELGGTTVLMAGGVIQEEAPSEQFFSSPKKEVVKVFVRTGTCSVPSPDADPETLDPDVEAPPRVPEEIRRYVSDTQGPRGFLWLKKGRLAGTPRPGIVQEIDYDLKALQRVGVNCLVTLTERAPETEEMAEYGIDNIWSAIPDMEAPSLEQAEEICQQIEQRLQADEVVAVHCRAGLGRTGTILAAYLIWEGLPALTALETVRRVEPRWVQSDVQVSFLEAFSNSLLGKNHVA